MNRLQFLAVVFAIGSLAMGGGKPETRVPTTEEGKKIFGIYQESRTAVDEQITQVGNQLKSTHAELNLILDSCLECRVSGQEFPIAQSFAEALDKSRTLKKKITFLLVEHEKLKAEYVFINDTLHKHIESMKSLSNFHVALQKSHEEATASAVTSHAALLEAGKSTDGRIPASTNGEVDEKTAALQENFQIAATKADSMTHELFITHRFIQFLEL